MEHVLLVIHLIITLALIVTILLQRSEGGGLVNQSGGLGSFASARTAGNVLTRATAILAALFFISNLSLALLAKNHATTDDLVSAVEQADGGAAPAPVAADEKAAAPEAPVDNGDAPAADAKTDSATDSKKTDTAEKAPAAPLAD